MTAVGDVQSAIEAHLQLIDQLLLAAAPRAADFSALMPVMGGAGPGDVIEALRRRERAAGSSSWAATLLADAYGADATLLPEAQPKALPLPHPLDSEWRFSSHSIEELMGRLIETTCAGDELLLVGTPSLAAALSRTSVDRRICFVGPDDVVSAAVRDLFTDDARFTTSFGGRAAAAVVDPPWYAEHFLEMLTICALGCRPGATILTIVPRSATRPGLLRDLEAILARAAGLGLELTNASALEVRYRTPLFEARSLECVGIRANLGDWRRGDCLTLRRLNSPTPVRPVRPTDPHVELTLAGCRIRLLPGIAPYASGMQPAENDEVSASVSARSPTRRKANLWTSTNRAFIVDEDACLSALSTIAEEEGLLLPQRLTPLRIAASSRNSVEARANLVHSIRELFKRERVDAARLAGEESWLTTARDMRCSGAWSSTSPHSRSGMIVSATSSNRVQDG